MRRVRCEVCSSENLVRNGKLFVCLNCGCRFFPESESELLSLPEKDTPTVEEILSHKGLNPVKVNRNAKGTIMVTDEFTGKSYTAAQYRAMITEQTAKKSVPRRIVWAIGDVFDDIFLTWDFETVAKVILGLLIPIFLIVGILGIRNGAPVGNIVFSFLIVLSAIVHISLIVFTDEPAPALIDCAIQIALDHFIIFGTLFDLEFIWRLIIGIILKITCLIITHVIADNL